MFPEKMDGLKKWKNIKQWINIKWLSCLLNIQKYLLCVYVHVHICEQTYTHICIYIHITACIASILYTDAAFIVLFISFVESVLPYSFYFFVISSLLLFQWLQCYHIHLYIIIFLFLDVQTLVLFQTKAMLSYFLKSLVQKCINSWESYNYLRLFWFSHRPEIKNCAFIA